MQVQPARVDQVVSTAAGEMVVIDADVGGVAADLKSIDPRLKIRFAEKAADPFWAVYLEDGRSTDLVTTVQAHQTRSGTWTGLDQRVVARIREIDSQRRGGYDFARELEKAREGRLREERRKFRERADQIGELAAHAVRKDIGEDKGRAFIRSKP